MTPTTPSLPKDVELRWTLFKAQELGRHSTLWYRSKAETINLFEEFLAQEITLVEARGGASERKRTYDHLCKIWDKGEAPTVEWRGSLLTPSGWGGHEGKSMKVIFDGQEYVPITSLKANFNGVQLMKALMSDYLTEDSLNTDEKILKEAQEIRIHVGELDDEFPTVLDIVSKVLQANNTSDQKRGT